MTSTQIRQSFLDFFKSKQHTIVPSSSLMPDSPNLLFTNAGMNQFVPIFLGQTQCPYTPGRAADTQKCIRAGGKHNDLDDVGLDTYHHTFFEMLGNWSFGDYFKKEAIAWAWELVVEIWKFPPTRVYATVYNPDKSKNDPSDFDQEAWDYWAEKFRSVGLDPAIHIVNGNKKDNFWMMGDTGPCGPCSELHIDLTPDGDTKGSLVNKGDARCIEIWNLVFIQFNANPDGTFSPLPAKHVDTGMGFERVTSIIQGTKGLKDFATAKISNYETDIFRPIFDALEKLSGKQYGSTLPQTTGSTGYQPVPVGDPPTGTERDSLSPTSVHSHIDASPRSAGLVARQDGPVARATQVVPGAIYSKRNLPHFEKPWAIYHIIINTIAPRKLSPAARDIVFDCILHWRESRYRLVAACVMPDHAHFIIQPGIREEDPEGNPVFWPLSEIIHSIKSYSAKEINKLDRCTGTLWQEERYDRYLRGDHDLQEKFHYLCRNPWAADLVKENEPWPWLWTPDIEAWRPYVALSKRTGSTGDSPVPVGDPPTGTGRDPLSSSNVHSQTAVSPHSAGQVAQRYGQVARATPGSALPPLKTSGEGPSNIIEVPIHERPAEPDPTCAEIKAQTAGGHNPEQIQIDIAFRVIADHIRTLSFAIADGIEPGNKERNSVLRRILRRAVRYGRILGFHEPFFYKLVGVLAETMGDVFPEIRSRKVHIEGVIRREEESFNKTLDEGIKLFENEMTVAFDIGKGSIAYAVSKESTSGERQVLEAAAIILPQEHNLSIVERRKTRWERRQQNALKRRLSGEAAFVLADTYGFPVDLTELMARERGFTVDTEEYKEFMEEAKRIAREARVTQVIELSQIETTTPTKFIGYENLATDAKVLEVVSLKDKTAVVLDTSACYAEMGGQVGDTGELTGSGQLWRITNTQKSGDTWLHFISEGPETGRVAQATSLSRQATRLTERGDAPPSESSGTSQKYASPVPVGGSPTGTGESPVLPIPGATVSLSVDRARRHAIERHHTVTHLLHWALHEVASKEASQKGSFVGPDKLTFDFNSAPLTTQQIADIEKLVNERIVENAPVSWTEVKHKHVKDRKDVMQFFGDKYGEWVRVVQIGGQPTALDGYSMELCGGTHTRATGEIGLFRIVGESAIAAGVRRIEAVAGLEAYGLANSQQQLIRTLAGKINSPLHELEKKVESLLAHQKELEKKLHSAIHRNAVQTAGWLVTRQHDVNGIPLITQIFPDSDAEYLQAIVDAVKERFKGVVVVGGSVNGAVTLIASVSPDFTAKVNAGKIIQQIAPIVGGKGGGKPDNARGGGKDASKLDEALAKVKTLLG